MSYSEPQHTEPQHAEPQHTEATPALPGQALPTMTDIEALAESLDRIDLTLAELDQPRPTPMTTSGPPGHHR